MRYDIKLNGKVLEIGGGSRPLFHPNMDIRELDQVDIIHDLNKVPYPFNDKEFDGIYGGYVLEHLSWRSVKNVIKEIYRILKDEGKAIFLVPNTLEQCKKAASEGRWKEEFSCMLFGDQNYNENAHACGFCPEFAKELFESVGFDVKIIAPMPDVYLDGVLIFPKCDTDMIIEARREKKRGGLMVKVLGGKQNASDGKREHPFDRGYFEPDIPRGYVGTGYRDFPCHYKTAEIVMDYAKKHNCKKILEIGSARGYVSMVLKSHGFDVTCMDISEHCYHTRVVKDFILWDMTETPWPFKDGEFDMIFSVAVLEHIPEDKIHNVIKEISRVSKCSIHGISTTIPSNDLDDTHVTIKPIEWWQSKFEEYCDENHSYNLMDKEMMEAPPYPIPPPDGLKKLNVGCFTNMFYYGWENIDIIDLSKFAKFYGYNFKQIDITKGLPYDDNSIDLIFSSHLIEHLSPEEGLNFLKECYRVLKDGGIIRLATPNALQLFKEYLNGEIRKYRHINKGVEEAETDLDALLNLLFTGHKTIYDFKKLYKLLKKAGFREIYQVSPWYSISEVMERQTFVSHPTISLVVDARKASLK